MDARLLQIERNQQTMAQDLADVKSKLDRLEAACSRIEAACGKMSTHIDFVDNVYTTVRSPFSSILRKFMGAEKALPEMKSGLLVVEQESPHTCLVAHESELPRL